MNDTSVNLSLSGEKIGQKTDLTNHHKTWLMPSILFAYEWENVVKASGRVERLFQTFLKICSGVICYRKMTGYMSLSDM